MTSEGDRLLVQQIRAGDKRAWESLIGRYEGRLLAFVKRRLQSPRGQITRDVIL